jgi:hypothetical protein
MGTTTQGLTANVQPTYQINEGNQLVGIHNITRDGAYMGAIKVGTGATLRQVVVNVPIEAAQYPGEILDERQVGEHYELDCEFVEQTPENIRILLDAQGINSAARSTYGKRNRLATKSQWCVYTEGPDGKNRCWTFYRAWVHPKDANIGHPTEVANVPVTLIISADRTRPENAQFFEVRDY